MLLIQICNRPFCYVIMSLRQISTASPQLKMEFRTTLSSRNLDSLPGKVDLNTGTICVNLNLKFSSIHSLIDADNLSCKISSQK